MKAMKTSIGLALSLLLLFFCVLFPVSAAEHPFTDVPEGSWYSGYVQYVYDNGLMNGTSTTTFSPETTMDRAMLVTVLYRMDGSKKAVEETPFTDVATNGYYYDALVWAYQSKIINGTSNTQFSPHIPISREMMVTIFYRYAQYIERDVSKLDSLNAYTDTGSISGYAKTPFMWSVANGIISGTSSTELSPVGTATRAQCAAVLQRFMEWTQNENGPEVHTHTYTTKIWAEATCTEGGYTYYKCGVCGYSYKDSETPARGHNWSEWKVIVAATTTDEGKSERKCSACGKVESRTDPINPAGHNHLYNLEITTQPTCTKQGAGYYWCACGAKYDSILDPQGHWYDITTVKPTCSEKGYDLYTCKRCDYSYKSGYVYELPHNYSEKVTKPACLDSGYTTYTCKDCGYSYKGNETAPTGHSYTETVTKPTCTEKGYTTYKCKNCSHSYKGKETNATGHKWGEWTIIKEPTTTTMGTAERKCANCDKVETRTIAKYPENHTHSYTGKVTTEATCTKDGVKTYACSCGDSYTEVIESTGHSYKLTDIKVATCTVDGYKKYTCSKCNDAYTETLKGGHDWTYEHTDAVSHYEDWFVCCCGGWEFNYADGDWTDSFVDHAQASGDAINHSYRVEHRWIVDTPAKDEWKCLNCGAVSTTKPQSINCLPVEVMSVSEGNGKKYAK